MKDWIEVKVMKLAIYFLKKGYGDCSGEEPRCAVCKAMNARKFLEEHIDLIKWSRDNP